MRPAPITPTPTCFIVASSRVAAAVRRVDELAAAAGARTSRVAGSAGARKAEAGPAASSRAAAADRRSRARGMAVGLVGWGVGGSWVEVGEGGGSFV